MPQPWYKMVPLFWPVLVTVASVGLAAASAETRLEDLTAKVNYIWDNGAPPVAVRLARIDERQEQMVKTLDRVDHKLDELDSKLSTQQHRGR